MVHQTIFSVKDLKQRVCNFITEKINDREDKIKTIENWQSNITSGKILKQKEEELQTLFLHTFFGDILNYEYKNPEKWNLSIEVKTDFDATKADGALGFFEIDKNKNINSSIRAIIELKNARTPLDKPQNRKEFKGSPVEQAFMYAHKIGADCQWVIVSNFLEIRLYQANDINKYESFDILSLTLDYEFNRFYYLLANGQLFLRKQLSVVQFALENRLAEQQKISKEFYAKYKTLRELFVQHLITHNKNIAPLKLLEFAQTVIDRIVFISVTKDLELIPLSIINDIEYIGEKSLAQDGGELWRQIKYLFRAMDKGFPQRIHVFNGGLFRKNPEIENLIIKDNFIKHLLSLSKYDFESDLSINILGHIFEQSITDIEKLRDEILANKFIEIPENIDEIVETKVTEETNQRKKQGVFYTPEYITYYIVKECIGSWIEDKKEELGLLEIQDLPKSKNNQKQQIELWNKYLDILSEITILDPACGSGAFLTQAFDYLYKEWQVVIDIIVKLQGEIPKQAKVNGALNFKEDTLPKKLQDWVIRKNIVRKNLFGVDLNNESVEITKLGLWLKTATKRDTLADLENNIKCGNSLIADENIAGDKAFIWDIEFKTIIESGGFDIILGNPPYVKAGNLTAYSNYFKTNYDVFLPELDLFGYFYEKAVKLLKTNGFLGFISNTFEKTNAATLLRSFLKKQVTIKRYIDFTEVNIWDDLTTYPVILIAENNRIADNTIKHSKLTKGTKPDTIDFNKTDLSKSEAKKLQHREIKQVQLNGQNWLLTDNKEYELLSKLQKHKTIKDEFGKCYRGIITGLNKAFIIDKQTAKSIKNIDEQDFLLPIYEGKDIKKWITPEAEKRLILFKSKWTRQAFADFVEKQEGDFEIQQHDLFYNAFRHRYNQLYDWLKDFQHEGLNRYDKGEYWWEMRNCAYYDKFEKTKIIFPNLQNTNKFSYDETGTFVNAPAVFLPVTEKYPIVILNSKLIWYFLKSICVVRSGGYIEVKPQYFEQIPIPEINTEQKTVLNAIANEMLDLNLQFTKKHTNFLFIAKTLLNVNNIPKWLFDWHSYDLEKFIENLRKQKKRIKSDEIQEWKDFFNGEIDEIQPVIQNINHIEKKIDKMVYKMYGLTDEEIIIIEKHNQSEII